MDPFSEFTSREIAFQSYWWGQQDTAEKARLYEQSPRFRRLFASLSVDFFFLFENTDPTLWPELVSFDYDILNRSDRQAGLLAQILRTLSPEDAIKAFLGVQQVPTRLAIMKRLSSASRNLVNKKLTEDQIKRFKENRDDPDDTNYFCATEEFIETLPPSARECFDEECVAMKWQEKSFQNYNTFVMTRCFKHSFHLACRKSHDCI